MRNLERKLAVSVLGFLFSVRVLTYEQSVTCRGLGDPYPSGYPFENTIVVGSAESGPFVSFSALWKQDALKYIKDYGLELKTHYYNYDDAESTGKGPAYRTAAITDDFYCNLPGCYIDSDLLSEKNSLGEYNEPQVAIGIFPVESRNINPDFYYKARILAIPGRGDNSLMKIVYYTTRQVAPIGISGVFHCEDISPKNLVRFQYGFRAPGCIKAKDITVDRC